MVKTPRDLPGDFNVGGLIHTYGNPIRLVYDNVGRLQYGIAQETKGG